MRRMTAVVSDEKHLELSEGIELPVGTRVTVDVEEQHNASNYATRLAAFYESSQHALEEERSLAEELSASDTTLPVEECSQAQD